VTLACPPQTRVPPTHLGYERLYSDESGVEISVRYDANSRVGGRVYISADGVTTDIAPGDLDWFIERLTIIRNEIAS